MNLNQLKTGDLIVRAKGIFSTHYMVFIENRGGNIIVAENQLGYGVRYVNLTEALKGNKIIRFEKFGGNEFDRMNVISRINNVLGKSYNLIAFNCEHFARMISQGKTKSKQVSTTTNIAILSGLGMMGSKNKTTQNLGITSLVFGILGKIVQP